MVDLGTNLQIHHVDVTNRGDCCREINNELSLLSNYLIRSILTGAQAEATQVMIQNFTNTVLIIFARLFAVAYTSKCHGSILEDVV